MHARTASEIFNVEAAQVDSQQRSVAKAINFGLMYGKTAWGLAQELRIGRNEAKDMIDRYFRRYSGVKKFFRCPSREAKERGYVLTYFGRRRNLPDIRSKNPSYVALQSVWP